MKGFLLYYVYGKSCYLGDILELNKYKIKEDYFFATVDDSYSKSFS